MNPIEHSPGLVVNIATPDLKLSDFGLIAFDMDSTLINIECVDEIADAVGRKAEVAAITEAAMRGEITDFKDSLRRRVALLKGVSVASMDEVYRERLKLNPGAAELVRACKDAGLKVLLVSGGFTFFADRVKELLDIDYMRANVLEIENGLLTGKHDRSALGRHLRRRGKAPHADPDLRPAGHQPAAGDCHGRRRERFANDGRGRPVSGLPRQAQGARAGDGGDQRGRAGPLARIDEVKTGTLFGILNCRRSRVGGNPVDVLTKLMQALWIPACAGMTVIFK